MTTQQSTVGPRLRKPKKQRQLKVRQSYHDYQLDQYDRTPIGEIKLKGNWLIQAGFAIDAPVTVRVMEGCLVITAEHSH